MGGWSFRLLRWWEFLGCFFAVRDFTRGCRCGWCFMITGRYVSSYVSRCIGQFVSLVEISSLPSLHVSQSYSLSSVTLVAQVAR